MFSWKGKKMLTNNYYLTLYTHNSVIPMFKTPTWLTLWAYSSEVLQAIEKKGWKLWPLDLIGDNHKLSQELEKAGILIWNNIKPIVLESPQTGMTEKEYQIFQKYHKINTGQSNWFHSLLSYGGVLIRGSVPWDWRSLVDIIPSLRVEATLESINRWIRAILENISRNESAIQYYARTTGVPFDKNELTLWVVSLFDVPIITVTENPNNGDFYIDDFQWKFGGITWWSKIFTATIWSDGKTKGERREYGDEETVKKVNAMRKILEWEGILDSRIAYQFEFWKVYSGSLILLQIKEMSRKIPTSIHLASLYPIRANKVLFWGAHGYSLPIILSRMPGEWVETRDIRNDTREWFAVFANNSSDIRLKPYEIDPNMRGVMSLDSHGGSLVHNSFRYVQQVLQSGWVALLGDKIWSMFEDPGKTDWTLEQLEIMNFYVMQRQEWNVEIGFKWWEGTDASTDILKRPGKHSQDWSKQEIYTWTTGRLDGKRYFVPKKRP